jgi:hypothetical protein
MYYMISNLARVAYNCVRFIKRAASSPFGTIHMKSQVGNTLGRLRPIYIEKVRAS